MGNRLTKEELEEIRDANYVIHKDLKWESDWEGYEVGYDHIPIVSLYWLVSKNIYLNIDMPTMKILDGWKGEEEIDV